MYANVFVTVSLSVHTFVAFDKSVVILHVKNMKTNMIK